MSYLPDINMTFLKNNVGSLVKDKRIDINELLIDLDMSRDVFNKIINTKSNREISPEMFQDIEIFCMKNNIKVDGLCGPLPEKYGERLKYFIFRHYMTQAEFSKKTKIPSSSIWNMITDKMQIGNKYKDRLLVVLRPDEFNLLSSYGDISIPEDTDKTVVNACNLSWNMYKYANKFFKWDLLLKELKIDAKDCDKFLAGAIKLTKPKIKIIAKQLKCDEKDLLEDSLNLNNIKNRFGYWLAAKIYKQNNSISMFADRCNINTDYLADIIKGECLIKDRDIKSIAVHLGIDPDGLVQVVPKTDLDLVPIAEAKMTLNEIVRARIANLGYSFKEFCSVMDINHNTLATSLHNGKLPLKNKEDIIRELDLQDRFPEFKEIEEEPKVAEDMMQTDDILDQPETITTSASTEKEEKVVSIAAPKSEVDILINPYPLSDIPIPEEVKVKVNLNDKDMENMVSVMYYANHEYQVSLAKFICKITNTEFTDELKANNIMGTLARMNLIKDNLK